MSEKQRHRAASLTSSKRQSFSRTTSSTRKHQSSAESVSPEPCSSTDVFPQKTVSCPVMESKKRQSKSVKPAPTAQIVAKEDNCKLISQKTSKMSLAKISDKVISSKEQLLQCAVPVYFKDPKPPPMVMHMQEIPLVDSVDEMYEHYMFNAYIKMELHIESIKADIEDLKYLNDSRRSQKRELTVLFNDHLMAAYLSATNVPRLFRVFCNTTFKNVVRRLDTLNTDVYHDNRLIAEMVKSGILTTAEPVMTCWRQNNLYSFIGSRILYGILQMLANRNEGNSTCYDFPRDIGVETLWADESCQQTMQNIYQSLSQSEEGIDGVVAHLFEYLERMTNQLEEMPKRFISRFYSCKNSTSADVVKNDIRRAKDDYTYFMSLANMQTEENQKMMDEVFSLGCKIMPEYEARMKKEARRNVNHGRISKVSKTEVTACRKKIAEAKAAIAVADKELWQVMDKVNGYHEQKLRHRYIERYKKSFAITRHLKLFQRQFILVHALKKQKRCVFRRLKYVKRQVDDNFFEIMEMSTAYFDRVILSRKLAGVEQHETLKKRWEKLQDERKKLHREFIILTATAKHHYPTAQKQLGEQFTAVRENILCETNPKLNHIAMKKALLEKIRRDEQEAKYYNRHSFVVPCPLPNRLRPPFSNFEHERQQVRQIKAMASQTASATYTTLQALSEPSQSARRDVLKRALTNEVPTSPRRHSPKSDVMTKLIEKSVPGKTCMDQETVFEKPLLPIEAKISTSLPAVLTSNRSLRRRSRTSPRRHDTDKERESKKVKDVKPRLNSSHGERERVSEKISSDSSRSRDTRDVRRESDRHSGYRREGSSLSHNDDRREKNIRDQRLRSDAARSVRSDDFRSRDESSSYSQRDDYSRISRRLGRDEVVIRPVRDDRNRSLRDDDNRRTRHTSSDARFRKRHFESPERGFKRPCGNFRGDYERKDRDDRDRRDERDRSRNYRGGRVSVAETDAKRPRRDEEPSGARCDSRVSFRTSIKDISSQDLKDYDRISECLTSKGHEKIFECLSSLRNHEKIFGCLSSSKGHEKVFGCLSNSKGYETSQKYRETIEFAIRKLAETAPRRHDECSPRKICDANLRKREEAILQKTCESFRKDSKKSSNVIEAKLVLKKPKIEPLEVDEKIAISTNEIDDLLEETFEPPKPKERKHLSLEEINLLLRDNRAVELGKMTPEQREKFMRSILPSQDRRPIYFPEVIGHPSNMKAYMKSKGFDDDNDPLDAPWRRALEVFTTKHYLKHVNQSLQRQLRNFAQTDLMNPLVYPIEIPRQIHINNKLARGQTEEFEKKKKFNANMLKAKTATATECFKILGNMKEALAELHEAEDTDLANFTEQARVQNQLRYVEDRVDALRRWNNNLRDRKNAFAVGNMKHEKMISTLSTINTVANTKVLSESTQAQTIAEKIAEKKRLIKGKKAELAEYVKKRGALMTTIVETDKKVRETKTKLKLTRRQLKHEKAKVAELEELDRPAIEDQQIRDYYASIVLCRICNKIPVDAGLKKCLHLFCRDCLTMHLQKPGAKKCPACNIRVTMKDYTRVFL